MSLLNSDFKQFSKLLDLSLEKKISPLRDQISTLATKEEVSKLATKEEVSKLATKEEVAKLATKEELTKITTEMTILRRMIIALPTKHNLAVLKDELLAKISHLPTKEQFYKKMDKWMKGVSTHDLEKFSHQRAHERLNDHLAHPHIL